MAFAFAMSRRRRALSGDPEDVHRTDRAILELFGEQDHVARWIRLASESRHSITEREK